MKKIKNLSIVRIVRESWKGDKLSDGTTKKTMVTWKGGPVEVTDTNGNKVTVDTVSAGKAAAQAAIGIGAIVCGVIGAVKGTNYLTSKKNEETSNNIEA